MNDIQQLFDDVEKALLQIDEMEFVAQGISMNRRLRDTWDNASDKDKVEMRTQVIMGLETIKLTCLTIVQLENKRKEALRRQERDD